MRSFTLTKYLPPLEPAFPHVGDGTFGTLQKGITFTCIHSLTCSTLIQCPTNFFSTTENPRFKICYNCGEMFYIRVLSKALKKEYGKFKVFQEFSRNV